MSSATRCQPRAARLPSFAEALVIIGATLEGFVQARIKGEDAARISDLRDRALRRRPAALASIAASRNAERFVGGEQGTTSQA